MLAKTLRDDQALAIGNLRGHLERGEKRIVLQGPTGMGKTVIIADITDRARHKDRKVLITVPAISLVDQTVEALYSHGVADVGVIQSTHELTDWSKPVQVASVQTLYNRWKEGKMPEADLVLVDEVHRLYDLLFSFWMSDPRWIKVPFIGFSATPWTRGLGRLYGRLLVANTMDDLIAQKVLVPFRTFAPDMPDLSEVQTSCGDFVESQLDAIMRESRLTANIVGTWKRLASDRVTVAFCCSRAHADQIAKEFAAAGVGAAYLDCESPLTERRGVRRAMLCGDVRIVCNVDVVGLGVDWPEVSCIIYARPTKSDIRFVQNVGRGLRACEGKTDLLILDHSTTTARLGFVNEIGSYHRTLDDGHGKAPAPARVLLPKECPACHLLKPPRVAVCPHCGHKVEEHADPILCERGTLREVTPDREMKDLRKVLPDKAHVFGQLWWWGHKKGYKPGWAAMKCRDIFGSFPKAREPDQETVSAPCPELLKFIYDSVERWKKDRYNERRRAARADDRPPNSGGRAVPKGAVADVEDLR